jgi:16S rRNA (guanine527-N7)-methyltransferase
MALPWPALDTGEALVNPVSGAPSLPAAAGPDAATEVFPQPEPWPGLATAAGRFGVSLDRASVARFARFRDLLLDRIAQFNLTAVRDPDEVERRLFLDALAMVPAVDHLTSAARASRPAAVRLVDIGSGAGFPGLALKVARPDLDVTLIDATAKKVAFLDEVIADLGLAGARAVHGRAEDVGRDVAFRDAFEIATARAVASLPVLLEYAVPLLAVGGHALLPKGLELDEELRRGRSAARVLGAEVISADVLPAGATRLVVARKIAPTPAVYPRRPGTPSRSPLGERT